MIYSWDHCAGFCQLAYSLHLMLWMLHLFINGEQMHAWAQGNLMLLAGTCWFIFMALWDMGLILKYPEFMQMTTTKQNEKIETQP